MAYNKRNKLLQMKRILDVYLREKRDGVSTAYVYRTYIFPQFNISISTLYNIIATPVERLLKEEDLKIQKKAKINNDKN